MEYGEKTAQLHSEDSSKTVTKSAAPPALADSLTDATLLSSTKQPHCDSHLSPAFGSGTYDPRVAGRRPNLIDLGLEVATLQQQASLGNDSNKPEDDVPEASDSYLETLTAGPSPSSPTGRKSQRRGKGKEGAGGPKSTSTTGRCDHCGRKSSPAWRKGPAYAPRLCNACGTHFAHRKSLEGYLPGMKQRDEEQQGRTPRNRSPSLRSQSYNQEAAGTASPEAEPSGQEPHRWSHRWSHFVSAALARSEDWRSMTNLVKEAIRAANSSSDPQERNMAAELERAQRLLWINKDAAVSLLGELSEVEMLISLRAGTAEPGAPPQIGGSGLDDALPTGGSEPRLFGLLRLISKCTKATPAEELAALMATTLQAAQDDAEEDKQLTLRLSQALDLLSQKPSLPNKLSALRLLDDYQPHWGQCQTCGKSRLADRVLKPWEDFFCGGETCYLPERSCNSAEDTPGDWRPLRLQASKDNGRPASASKRRRVDDAQKADQDALVRLAEVATEEVRGENPADIDASFDKGQRSKRYKITPASPEEGLELLPVGWRLETTVTKLVDSLSAPERVYVCPSTGARYSDWQKAVEKAEGPWRLMGQPAEKSPTVRESWKPGARDAGHSRQAVGQFAGLPGYPSNGKKLAPARFPTIGSPVALAGDKEGSPNGLQGELASLQAFKDWKGSPQITASSLADVVKSANAAACQPLTSTGGILLHPGLFLGMAPPHRGKLGTCPPSTTRADASKLTHAGKERDAMAGTRKVLEEGSPAGKKGGRVKWAASEAGPQERRKQAQAGAAAEGSQARGQAELAQGAGSKEKPTVVIVTSAPSPQPQPSFVSAPAFPGFSRGYSTVTTAAGLERHPVLPAAANNPSGGSGQMQPPSTRGDRPTDASAKQVMQKGARTITQEPQQRVEKERKRPSASSTQRLSTETRVSGVESRDRSDAQKAAVSLPPSPSLRDLPSEGLQLDLTSSRLPQLFRQQEKSPTCNLTFAVPERSQPLGRAISDPQVLTRELEGGLQILEGIAEEPPALTMEQQWQLLTMQQQQGVGEEEGPPRPLGRALSDPASFQIQVAEALRSSTGYLPSGTSLVTWQAVVKLLPRAGMESLELFSLVAALPVRLASSLPAEIPVSQFKPRSQIFMAAVADKPLLLHLGPVNERQRGAVIQMEELKLAAVAQLDGFELALIPHINSRNSLHIVGLKMEQAGRIEAEEAQPNSPPPRGSATAPIIMSSQWPRKNGGSEPPEPSPNSPQADKQQCSAK